MYPCGPFLMTQGETISQKKVREALLSLVEKVKNQVPKVSCLET